MPAALTADKALASAREAHARALELEEQAAAARAKGQQIDADSVDLIVENPAKAEDVSRQVETQERLARAYATKAAAEHTRAKEHALDALYREAAALDKEAEKLDREADDLEARIDKALADLKDLSNIDYVDPFESGNVEPYKEYPARADVDRRARAEELRRRAEQNRYYVKFGTAAVEKSQLNPAHASHGGEPAMTPFSVHLDSTTHSELLNRVINGTVYDEDHQ